MKHVDSRTLTDLPLFWWQVQSWENVKRRCVAQVSPEGREDAAEGGWVGGRVSLTGSNPERLLSTSPSLFFAPLCNRGQTPVSFLTLTQSNRSSPGGFPASTGCWSPNSLDSRSKLPAYQINLIEHTSIRSWHKPTETFMSLDTPVKEIQIKLGLQRRITLI